MTPYHQDVLHKLLDKAIEKFFIRYGKKGLVGTKPKQDAVGVLVVLSQIAGELIRHAPKDMQDNLFMAFADGTAKLAGIKEDEEIEEAEVVTETLQ